MSLHHHNNDLLSEIVEKALEDPPKRDPDEPRDPVWLRWIECGVLIVAPAIVFGLAFAFRDYITQFTSTHLYDQEQAKQRVQNDSATAISWRFIIGAAVGAALGTIYVVRRIVRKADS